MAPEFDAPIEHLPIVPKHVLKKHKVDEPLDTRFRSAARLLQALWRDDRNLPIGSYVGEDGRLRKLGSRISDAAGLAGGNFLTPEIARITRRLVAYREMGALIDESRLYTNLLSSMPLAFNVFAPFVMSMEAATGFLTELIPGFHGVVNKLLFEHSPGRGKPMFLADHSAFDVFFEYRMADGKRGFVAIEIKYSECMREPVPSMRPRYDEVSTATKLFVDPFDKALRSNPLQQLWREHMLSQCLIENGLYDEGSFVLIAPRANHHVREAAVLYESHLAPLVDGKARFVNLTLDDVVETIRLNDAQHAAALHRRYLDFWLVDGEIELHEPLLSPRRERLASPANSTEHAVGSAAGDECEPPNRRVPAKRPKRPATV